MILSLLLFLSIPLHAEFTPLPASTPESTNSNFKTIDEEIRRLDSVISSTYGVLGVLNGTNTWTGGNTFTNPPTANGLTVTNNTLLAGATNSFSGYTVLGSTNASMAKGIGGLAVYAKSVDDITLSSGCLVILGSGRTVAAEAVSVDPSVLVFTSTTTQASVGQYGILLDESCAPSTVCTVAIWGVARMVASGVVPVAGIVTSDTTRCRGYNSSNNLSNYSAGTALSATGGAGEWFWIFLGGR